MPKGSDPAELTLEAPLVVPAEGAIQLQVSVGPAEADGQRPVQIHARRDEVLADRAWTRHASGRLAPAEPPAR